MSKRYLNRRAMMALTGSTLGGIVSSGLGGAESTSTTTEDPAIDWIVIEDGKVVLDAEPEDIGRELHEQFTQVVKSFNLAIEAGHITFTTSEQETLTADSADQGGDFEVHSEPSEIAKAVDSVESPSTSSLESADLGEKSEITALGCNKDDSNVDTKWGGIRKDVELYMSDSTIDDLNALGSIGSGSAAVVAATLKSAGVIGSMSNPLTVALGGIVAIYIGTINLQNNGCGVVVKSRITPAVIAAPITATPTVHSQSE